MNQQKTEIDVEYTNGKLVLVARVGNENHPIVVMGPDLAKEVILKLQDKLNQIYATKEG